MRTRGTAVAVAVTALLTAGITTAIVRAPSPRFDRLLFGLEGDGMITLREPGMPDGDYRVPVGTRCRLYRLYPKVSVIQVEDGRLAYATDEDLLDDTSANRDFIKGLRRGVK